MYDRGSNSVVLGYADPASGSGWLTPGSSQTAFNSRCTLHAAGSSVTNSGNALTVQWQVTFWSGGSGTHNLWSLACDYAGACANGGWTDSGDYVVGMNSPPTLPMLSPSFGSGVTQSFTLSMYDANGADDFQFLQLLVNNILDGSTACYLVYDRPSNSIGLAYSTSGGWMQLPSGGTASNGQCTLNAGQSGVTASGGTLTVTWNVTFKTAFAGFKEVWVLGADRSGAYADGGWVKKGTYTVINPSAPSVIGINPAWSAPLGPLQTFTFEVSDPAGAANLDFVQLDVQGDSKLCRLKYFHSTATAQLEDERGNRSGPAGIAGGTELAVDNCAVGLSGSNFAVTPLGLVLRVTVGVEFSPGIFAGNKSVYLFGRNRAGAATSTSPQQVGTVVVPGASAQGNCQTRVEQ